MGDDAPVHLHGELAGDRQQVEREASSADSMIARLNAECAAAGITRKPSTVGETIGPPAEKLYGVEPVEVARSGDRRIRAVSAISVCTRAAASA